MQFTSMRVDKYFYKIGSTVVHICVKFNVNICLFSILPHVFCEKQKVNLAIFIMSDLVEQRSCIKFCLRIEMSSAETMSMLQRAFGDQDISQKNVYKWYKQFKEGRERVADNNRPGLPLTSTDEQHIGKLKYLVLKIDN